MITPGRYAGDCPGASKYFQSIRASDSDPPYFRRLTGFVKFVGSSFFHDTIGPVTDSNDAPRAPPVSVRSRMAQGCKQGHQTIARINPSDAYSFGTTTIQFVVNV